MPNIAVGPLIDSSMVLALFVREENNIYGSDNTSAFCFWQESAFLKLNQFNLSFREDMETRF